MKNDIDKCNKISDKIDDGVIFLMINKKLVLFAKSSIVEIENKLINILKENRSNTDKIEKLYKQAIKEDTKKIEKNIANLFLMIGIQEKEPWLYLQKLIINNCYGFKKLLKR